MVPRYDWMHRFRLSVESVRTTLSYARNEMNNKANLNEVILGIDALKKGMNK